jgi:acyl-CoA synthetase (NDP forming)
MQMAIQRTARENSIRLVGPNCLGVLSNHPDVRLNATFSRVVPPPGGLAIASQSGGVGIALLDLAAQTGVGVTCFISLGNKADVSGNDVLAAWYDDDNVTGAALYLESFGNARKFARIARTFAERKPLLAVVGGRSSGGVRAGASHTAAAAAPTVGVDALFTTAGVIACHSAEEMAHAALFLQQQPLPRGRRVGIVSNAGGVGVLAADAADAAGLVVPELSRELRAELREHVSGTAGTSNPVDLGAAANAATLTRVVGSLARSGEIDSLIVALVDTSVTDSASMVDALGEARAQAPELPVALVAMGGLEVRADETRLTRYAYPDDAIGAVRHAAEYAEWLARPHAEAAPVDQDRARAVRAVAGEVLSPAPASGAWVPPAVVARMLEPYGLHPSGVVVRGPSMATEAASVLGFPVAVKVADEHVVHKTERRLVRIGLETAPAVAAAVRDFASELGTGADVPVLVQPMATGVEVALGVVRDPGFGPLVMVAAGGVATGIWNDRVFLLPPISPQDAARALRSLRIWPLLAGYRGGLPADTEELERVVVALGEFAREVPELAELDLNPVVAAPDGVVLVDVKMRVAPASTDDEGVPRHLRMG